MTNIETKFYDVELSVKTYNLLKFKEIYTFQDLIRYSKSDLRRMLSSQKIINELEIILKENNLELNE